MFCVRESKDRKYIYFCIYIMMILNIGIYIYIVRAGAERN